MENQHRQIAGYRELNADEIALMNEAKAIERRFNSFIDKLRAAPGIDQRNVAMAATHGEDAFMRAVRAVAQPARLTMASVAAFEPAGGMIRHVGTKVIDAQPMTRGEWCALRNWSVPANENPSDEGYLVEYTDREQPLIPGHQGYCSWSPKDVFEQAYTPL
jgi:hypothetical protein